DEQDDEWDEDCGSCPRNGFEVEDEAEDETGEFYQDDWNEFEGEDDYEEDEWESSYSSSEVDDSLRLWPDPFDQGTEASSAPSPTPSVAAEQVVGTVQWAETSLSVGLKVVCFSRPPDNLEASSEQGEGELQPITSAASPALPERGNLSGDFRSCPASYWARNGDRHLPVISRPASPEFPSLVRSRVPSQSQPALQSLPLVKASHSSEMSPQKPSLAASCPQLPGTKARMRREQEENNFLSRQQQHSGLQSRRQRSMMQRDILRKSQAAEDVEFLGSKGKEGFRTFLLKKFGTIISGWRALDADNSGRLGFVEFCQACRVVGFHGNFKKLWAELDVRGGMVCLADVDPEVSRYLSAFKKALVKKYGDLITAWFQCIDVHRDGQVQVPRPRAVCPTPAQPAQGKPPMFGDYEAQRHWMELTTALPVQQWYEPGLDNDLQYWGLDYPPLTAFHSWLLGMIGRLVDPACFELHSSRGYEGVRCKVFMRLSVVVSDLLVYLPGALLASRSFGRHGPKRLALLWLLPPLLIIDHGHFQYNGVCFGLCLLGASFVARRDVVLASVFFTAALLFKQIALYYAPAFFFGILGLCLQRGAKGAVLGVAKAGATVLGMAGLLLSPWLLGPRPVQAVLQVLHRMFPFARGLYEDKVANFWCSISVVVKIQRLLPAHLVPPLCALCTLLALLPSALCTLRRSAGAGTFGAALFCSSLSFFLFAFQVHEKGVLFPAVACCLLPRRSRDWLLVLHFQMVSLFSMYPLMVKDQLWLAYFGTQLCLLLLVGKGHRALVLLWVLVAGLLHGLHAWVPPPAKYPDLWTLLITGASCGYFLCALLGATVAQLRGAFDESKDESLAFAEWCNCCGLSRLGLDLNPSKLFNMLRSPSSKALTLLDFDPEAWKKHMAGEGPEGPEGPAVASSPKEEKKEKAAAFRQALSRRFGSLLHAWREELDPDGAGRVTFGEFCLVLSRLGLRGEVRSLWTELTKKDETGFLSFRDLDPQTDQMVSELREKLTQEFQNMLLAWIKGLDTRGTGLVSEKQFLRCCQKVGFTGDAKDLFHRLKPDAGRSLMTIQDFDTKAFHALSRGDFRMLSEPAQGYHGKSPLELTFHERNEAGFFYQARRAADAARRKEFAKACRTAQPAFCINTIEDFEDLCIRKHGSLIAAWRQCLDAHANGKPGPQRPRTTP
ncbi:unnamed protein product, partial [Effrenium voratum]